MSDAFGIGDRVRVTGGRHQGKEGHVMGLSPIVQGRQIVLIEVEGGRKLVALPKDLEKIERLVH